MGGPWVLWAPVLAPWLLGSPPSLPLRYSPKSPLLQSETVHYKRGVSQHFSLPSFKIDFSEWKDDEVTSRRDPLPLAPPTPQPRGHQALGMAAGPCSLWSTPRGLSQCGRVCSLGNRPSGEQQLRRFPCWTSGGVKMVPLHSPGTVAGTPPCVAPKSCCEQPP